MTLTWSPPPDVPTPHLYDVIDESNSGVIIAQVPGRVHSYTVTGLAPDGSGQYSVDANWSGTWSGTTPALTAMTRLAPLDHDYAVKYTTTAAPGGGASLHVGQAWTDDWAFTPTCAGAHAAMQLDSPYATVNNPIISVVGQTQACPAQSWSFTIAGHPSSNG